MRAKAQKWGNSLAIRIPKTVAEQVGIGEDDDLELNVVNRQIRISARLHEPTLDELLAGISPDNLHGEIGFGEP
ncbi:MAG TPA: AbrB/MazE/SpoVT family DNA-binding domain-containing protein, partial [Gammaproteobacteria bacterium]|nr:AbrB/MazE/SpoVT family DNA-binding domain-containing protein [Gammaproteobacteria bacterium]